MIRAAILVSSFLLVSCAGARPAPVAELRVIVEPEDAQVYVNDRFAGTGRVLSGRPERLRVGVHFVTITRDGYFPHDVEVDLPEGLSTLEVSLRSVPP